MKDGCSGVWRYLQLRARLLGSTASIGHLRAHGLGPGRWLAIVVGTLLCGSAACSSDDGGLRVVGSVERTLIELVAPVSEVLRRVEVEPGQHVEAGATVAVLDSTLAEADLASADATLASARAGLSVAREEYARARKLQKDGVISSQQLDRAKLTLDEATARQREAEVRREAAEKRLADLTLTAPAAGTIDQLPFEPGERLPAGSVVVVLAQDAPPWVRIWIPERAVSRVAPGGSATVFVDGFAPLSGRVIEVAREPEYTPHFALTERERALLVFEARVLIREAPKTLRAGMPAEVEIPLVPTVVAPAGS